MIQSLFHAAVYLIGRIDPSGFTTNAAEADFKFFAELFEDGKLAGAGGGELHGQVMDVQAVELLEDGIVAAFVLGFAADAGAGATAEMDGKLDVLRKTIDDGIGHLDGE